MASLTIRHVTTYRYRQPVAFGEHRMMFRPRDSSDQRVTAASLAISPEPASLDFIEDAFGNHVGVARFSERAAELRFESIVGVEQSLPPGAGPEVERDDAGNFPVVYGAEEMPGLAPYIERHHLDPQNEVGRWACQFLSPAGPIGNVELLIRLSRGIHEGFRYQRRDAKGIQAPQETLRLHQGSCRDFAMLLIEAARSLGFAARFASGYLAIPFDDAEEPMNGSGGSTHAWAQVYLPDTGWIDFDPTSGSTGTAGLVAVAVVRDPYHAIPLHGTFIGDMADHLGMEVHVSVISATSNAKDAG